MIVRIICVSIAPSNEPFRVPWLPFKFTVHIKFSIIYFITVPIIFWKFWWLIIKFSSSFSFGALITSGAFPTALLIFAV